MDRVCIYHGGCPDGCGAALAGGRSWGEDARYIARRHEDTLCAAASEGARVVYLDIAPGNDELLAIVTRWTNAPVTESSDAQPQCQRLKA